MHFDAFCHIHTYTHIFVFKCITLLFRRQTDHTNQFYSPFDAWRKNFPPSTDGSTQFWPSFHNFEPAFRRSDPESIYSSEERTSEPGDSREPFGKYFKNILKFILIKKF